ncbi:cuticle protein 7-like [Macrobrachium rosenbergii]|uniref:cuticle protein 7-like n=1 Tax=Macrobrachium rosenbergii TaxID=79674 RepID=UPI0034D4BDE3
MASKVLLLIAIPSVIIAATQAILQYAPLYDYSKPVLVQKTPQYSFGYALKDDHLGNDFGHEETRDGYDTKGHYYANLPGGSFQKVSYFVAGGSELPPKVFFLLAVATASFTCATARAMSKYAPSYDYGEPVLLEKTWPLYSFSYVLKDDYSGSDFGHEEVRAGYDTKGHYYVNLPRGSFQKVSYYVGGSSGLSPQVSYLKDQLPVYTPPKVTYAH